MLVIAYRTVAALFAAPTPAASGAAPRPTPRRRAAILSAPPSDLCAAKPLARVEGRVHPSKRYLRPGARPHTLDAPAEADRRSHRCIRDTATPHAGGSSGWARAAAAPRVPAGRLQVRITTAKGLAESLKAEFLDARQGAAGLGLAGVADRVVPAQRCVMSPPPCPPCPAPLNLALHPCSLFDPRPPSVPTFDRARLFLS